MEDGYSDWFEVFTGVRQGCCLSLHLFAQAIDVVMKQVTQGKDIKWTDEKNISDMDFDNSISALARSTQDLQILIDHTSSYAGNIYLFISAKKTKNMYAGEHPTTMDVLIGHKKVESGKLYVPQQLHQ